MNDEQVPTGERYEPETQAAAPAPQADPFGPAPAEPLGQDRPDPFAPAPAEPLGQDQPDPFAPAQPDPDPFGPAYPATQPFPAATTFPSAPTYGWSSGDAVGAPVAPPASGKRRTGFLVPLAVVLALVAGVVGGAVGYGIAEQRDSQSSLTDASASLGAAGSSGSSERPDDSIAGIAGRVLPTVVAIGVETSSTGGSGSGFVIDQDGYILTNNHVIDAAVNGGRITVTYADGESEQARIVGRDTSYDLAVLKVERTGLSAATLGNSDNAVVGDAVVAVGAPLGLQGTVTAGIVSAKNRPVTTTGDDRATESFINAIQTDAAINPGNSGGPLVDASASVIGVASAIASLSSGGQTGSIGLGFAIPINQARRVAEEIIRTGVSTHPVIGASVDSTFDGPGARIAAQGDAVTSGGPAAKAGIKPGDIVLEVDGRAVNGAGELIVAIRANDPGETISLTVRTPGDGERTVEVTLGSQTGS